MKTVRIWLTFYRRIFFASAVFTLACGWIIHQQGLSALKVLFWFRLAAEGLIYFFVNGYRQPEYDYYFNMGVSRKALWTPIFVVDALLFIAILYAV